MSSEQIYQLKTAIWSTVPASNRITVTLQKASYLIPSTGAILVTQFSHRKPIISDARAPGTLSLPGKRKRTHLHTYVGRKSLYSHLRSVNKPNSEKSVVKFQNNLIFSRVAFSAKQQARRFILPCWCAREIERWEKLMLQFSQLAENVTKFFGLQVAGH